MKKLSATTKSNMITYGLVIVLYAIFQFLLSTGNISNSLAGQLVPICVYISLAVSLNLVVGISGELSLGHAGFMSVGAFTGVVIAICLQSLIPSGLLRLVVAMLGGGIMAAIAGLIIGIPVLRLRGDYLAIVTLAFGEIIKNIVNNLYVGLDSEGLHMSLISLNALKLNDDGILIINGPLGATGITKLSNFTVGFFLVLFTLVVVLHIINSRQGRAIMSARDNRIAADSVGISVTQYKLMAFVIAAALAGIAGAFYAMNYSTIAAKKFDFNTSILILVFVVLGGMGNIRGSVIAAAILVVLPELLRPIRDYRMLIYAVVLIVVMLARNNVKLKQYLNMVFDGVGKVFSRALPTSGRKGGGNQ